MASSAEFLPQTIIHSDPETLNGTPVFLGTRVPVASLFWHLERGITLDEFLDDFPTVSREQVTAVLQMALQIFQHPSFQKMYASAA